MTPTIDRIVANAVGRLEGGHIQAQWAACATVWVRMWTMGNGAWLRWPEAAARVFEALQLALARAAGVEEHTSDEFVLVQLEAIDVDDDGSAEWQYLVDLAAVLTEALGRTDPLAAVEMTIRTYLEGAFNILANQLAVQQGKPVSQSAAEEHVEAEPSWIALVGVVNAL